jgi:hypothetical protein
MDTKVKTKTRKNAKAKIEDDQQKFLSGIGPATVVLLTEIRSLQLASQEIQTALSKNTRKHIEAMETFLFSFPRPKKGHRKTSLPVSKFPELTRLSRELEIAASSFPLSLRGLFLVLISKWDAYIGALLRWVYDVKPEIIDKSTRSILYTDLHSMVSIEDARTKIVDEEVSSVLRESHVEHFAYLEKKLGIPLRDLDMWPEFVELTQRRHLVGDVLHIDEKVFP